MTNFELRILHASPNELFARDRDYSHMPRQYTVGCSMLSARSGELFSSAPINPVRIFAETAIAALESFTERAEGTILQMMNGRETVDAKVRVDGRVFRVSVSDGR
jgi:hypothetical protein